MTIRRFLGYMFIIVGFVLCLVAVGQNMIYGTVTEEIRCLGMIMTTILVVSSRKKAVA